MGTLFVFVYHLFNRFKVFFSILFLLITGLAAYFATQLTFSEDITKVLPRSEKISKLNFVYENAKFMDKVVFNIRLKDSLDTDPNHLVDFAERLSDSLEANFIPAAVRSIDKAPDENEMMAIYDAVYDNLPLFFDEEDYEKIAGKLQPDSINKTLEANYKTLVSPMGMGTKRMIAKDPLHLTPIALNKFRTFQVSDNLKLYRNQFLSIDEKNLLLLITPQSTNNTSINKALFEGIDKLIFNLQQDGFENIKAEYFGSPVVALGNAERIKSDIMLTVSLSMVALILFITLFFKRKRTFIVIFLPVAFGAIVSIAALAIFQNEVSAISLGIGSVLLGISLDYALHIFSHYRAHRDIPFLLKDLSTPIILSSITTAGAFLSLRFVNSQALQDLGLFAAISVLSAALFSLVVLPHLIRIKNEPEQEPKLGWIDRIAAYPYASNKYLQWGIILFTLAFIFLSQKVSFDADMMKNNYMSDELKQAEEDLNKVTSLSKKTIYLVTPGNDLDKALANNRHAEQMIDSLTKEGIIEDAVVATRLFRSETEQQKAIDRWNTFWENRKTDTKNLLIDEGAQFKFSEKAFNRFYEFLDKDFSVLPPDEATALSRLYLDNYTIQTDTLAAVINVVKVNSTSEDIEKVYEAFENQDGVWLIDKRVVLSEFLLILKNNFDKLVSISLFFVFLILLISYGRIELTLITMIPVIISWIWAIGIMGLLGISFNIFNIIILTFIFGLGIDYSIFIMRGLLQEYKYGHREISSYKVSVIISAITTLIGIGVLIFAKHPALKSIATMSIIGILSVVFVTFTLLPVIFNWMVSYKKGLRNRPVTLLDFFFSILSLIIFVGGALLMSLFSLILRILPGSSKKKKYIFHIAFSKLTWFLIYVNFLSPKRIINPNKEDYSKPAIIIANHQSHIDLMLMMLLNPKVLILTNRRNYSHPFYGKALQYADFLPSDIGYEEIAEDLKRLIADGYSFMIFPEGHRNDDGFIKRFHQGAFYLAQQLNIDILPIIIHGQNQLLKKSEFFLKRGTIVTKFLPRINLSENKFGETLREQTKGINKWFRKEYAAVREEHETPAYWSDYIVKNFTYKGPVLEWYTRIKLKIEDNYSFINGLVPRQCSITEMGCGYGYLAFMLNLVSEERTIKAYDYDGDKIAVANNCAIKTDMVEFFTADITELEPDFSDVFILKDVLHYLPENLQIDTIEKCINKMNAGGMIIIRDSDKELKGRHSRTKLTEFFSTNFGFNKTKYALDFVSRKTIMEIAIKQKLRLEIVDQGKVTSNLLYVLRR